MTPRYNGSSSEQEASLISLLQRLRIDATTLLQQEAALAKAEVRENVTRAGESVGRMAIGGGIAHAGAIVFLFGAARLLEMLLARAGLDPAVAGWVSHMSFGGAIVVTGWILLRNARRGLKRGDVVPEQTLESLRRSGRWAKAKFSSSP